MINYKARILAVLYHASTKGCTWRELKIRTGVSPSPLLGRDALSQTAEFRSALQWLMDGYAVCTEGYEDIERYYTT